MRKTKLIKGVIIALCVCAAVAALAWLVFFRDNSLAQYNEEAVSRQTVETYYTFSGNVESMDSQLVMSTSNLSVKKFHVREGDRVKAGDILFDLDDKAIISNVESLSASLEIAKINYETAQTLQKDQQTTQVRNALESAKLSRQNAANAHKMASENYDRMKALFEANVISKAELDSAKTSLDSAKAGLDSADIALGAAQKSFGNLNDSVNQSIRVAREQLNQAQAMYDNITRQRSELTVKSEVSGDVVEIFVAENESLIMGTRIMSVIDYDNLKISIRIDEYDLPVVTVGKDARVIINALDLAVDGVVDSISREATPLGNISYFPASIRIPSNELIRVGLSAEVRILNQRSVDVIAVSMKAIRIDQDNKPFVYIKDENGKPKVNYVDVGINDANTVEITGGLSESDILLVPRNNYSAVRAFRPIRNMTSR